MEGYRWIDVSLPLTDELLVWPGDEAFRLVYRHENGNCRISSVSMSLHSGTHLDAPLHYNPHGIPIDDAPLRLFVGPVRVVEFPGHRHIGLKDLRLVEPAHGERILFKTVNSRLYEAGVFRRDYVALTKEAASYLAGRRATLVGIDYLSVEPWESDGEVHRILAEAGVWVLEGLNLKEVEPGEYLLICIPLRLVGAEASPVRALLGKPTD